MTPLSPSELVYLHADQFITPRQPPVGGTATVLSTGRNVYRYSMMTEVLKAAIIANVSLGLLQIQLKPLEATQQSKARLEQIGAVERLVVGMVGKLEDKPQSHLSRLAAPSLWRTGMLEALLLNAHDEAVAQPVQDTIVQIFGDKNLSSTLIIRALHQTLESRGVIASPKRFLLGKWTLNRGHATGAQLEAVKQMLREFERQQPELAAQLGRDVEAGLSRNED